MDKNKIDIDNKRKRQDTLAESSASVNTPIGVPPVNPPILIPPTGIIKNTEEHVALTTQLDEVTKTCCKMLQNMEIINQEQVQIKNYISKRDEQAETNIKKLEFGIKNVLDQNNVAMENQVTTLKKEVQQLQQVHHTSKPVIKEFQTKDVKVMDDNSNKPVTEALRLLGSDGTYNGDPARWFEYKLRIENIIEALDLTKEQAIKFIRLSFTGNAVFISENIKRNHIFKR